MHECECLIGARGRYNPVSGASFCEECPVGTLSLEDRTACRTCLAGEYSYEDVECRSCTTGRYAPQALTDACLLCMAGYSTNNVTKGATTCSVSGDSMHTRMPLPFQPTHFFLSLVPFASCLCSPATRENFLMAAPKSVPLALWERGAPVVKVAAFHATGENTQHRKIRRRAWPVTPESSPSWRDRSAARPAVPGATRDAPEKGRATCVPQEHLRQTRAPSAASSVRKEWTLRGVQDRATALARSIFWIQARTLKQLSVQRMQSALVVWRSLGHTWAFGWISRTRHTLATYIDAKERRARARMRTTTSRRCMMMIHRGRDT